MSYPNDDQFQEVRLTRVNGPDDGPWDVTREDGWSFYVPTGSVKPKVGSMARLYGKGIGYAFRGLFIDGAEVFYRTEEEEHEHQAVERYGRDAADVLARWDDGQSVWSVEMGGFGPGYEQAIQLTAFEVLRHFLDVRADATKWENEAGWTAAREAAGRIVFPIVEPLGLSGAQWGAAVGLAARLYRDGPRKFNEAAPDDRRIQVSKHFPSLAPTQPETSAVAP